MVKPVRRRVRKWPKYECVLSANNQLYVYKFGKDLVLHRVGLENFYKCGKKKFPKCHRPLTLKSINVPCCHQRTIFQSKEDVAEYLQLLRDIPKGPGGTRKRLRYLKKKQKGYWSKTKKQGVRRKVKEVSFEKINFVGIFYLQSNKLVGTFFHFLRVFV